ncbi:hypothetical protein P175DRAFT_0520138 [Aspergillus ochraceoroseus IBT 24754]|uniref:Uncharacterized protein n=3 Tax=Aspergillus subgen. Nidulantes TaxID=2720870 RepID=A0A0F8V1K6_9EURO|nr:uncharacterized protein P175DRAFT_0520138 [Aspergillus ochraceoroseus IBT 24754]KKK16901.1 hypothetical protein ARAM_002678 [Aspergillus rambellii]KKK19677.1 hypothetical protein AOCH_000834 [Aspergillus ochraceoroseus]PTU24187.1 hypothetical protein P175DRAFT_0520138 [Aspergillus ochraceoroseus IBT 24754]
MVPSILTSPTSRKSEDETKLAPSSPQSIREIETKTAALPFVPETEPIRSPIRSPIRQDDDYDPFAGAKPCSPFYRHATLLHKVDRLTIQPKRSRSVEENPTDNEESRVLWRRLDDDEAPDQRGRGPKLWVQEKRRCDCMQGLTKKQRLLVKVAVAVITVGSMVAIAVGITAAVGGGVWKPDHQQKAFGG